MWSERRQTVRDLGPSLASRMGGDIEHRAMRRLPLTPSRMAGILLLPPAFDLAAWWVREHVAGWWVAVLSFWIEKLDLGGSVTLVAWGPAWLGLSLPHLDLPTRQPGLLAWSLVLVVALTAGLAAKRLPDSLLPLQYMVWTGVFIQATALAYFAVRGTHFPYTAPAYLDDSFRTVVVLAAFMPWLHALTYYLFAFGHLRNLALTTLTLVFLAVAAPLQIALHAWMLDRFTVLVMPVLYFLGGVWVLILGCIGIYGFAMSWPHGAARTPAPRRPDAADLREPRRLPRAWTVRGEEATKGEPGSADPAIVRPDEQVPAGPA